MFGKVDTTETYQNPVADNMPRLENVLDDPLPINDSFPDEQLAVVFACDKFKPYIVDSKVTADTSPSYLLFQTLLPLFWTLTCMI